MTKTTDILQNIIQYHKMFLFCDSMFLFNDILDGHRMLVSYEQLYHHGKFSKRILEKLRRSVIADFLCSVSYKRT